MSARARSTSGEVIRREQQLFIYPAKHFVLPEERIASAVVEIKEELTSVASDMSANPAGTAAFPAA